MAKRTNPGKPPLDPMRYLKERKGNWQYVRRVPAHVAPFDARGLIQVSLKTKSADVAKLRRDALERADDLFWQGLAGGEGVERAQSAYDAAIARARVMGFEYRAAVDTAATASVEEILRRLHSTRSDRRVDMDAALGGVDQPKLKVSEVRKTYLEVIAIGEAKGMSPKQARKREEQKRFAADKFIEVVGDIIFLETTREQATRYHEFWMERVLGRNGHKKVSGNTANRAFGNIRKMFRDYANYIHADVKNPFDGLTFPDRRRQKREVPPFPIPFIQEKLLAVGAHDGLNAEALAIFLVLIETGARPSEICNLIPEHIHLRANVPYLSVDFQEERVIKTESSVRDIPLMGVALAVMRNFPNGFPRYRDKEDTLSATLMKHLRAKGLLPTSAHRVYSTRHSFEKRMLEAGLDFEFRKSMLGHSVDREKYGDGGGMAWRLEQLRKIELPFDAAIVPEPVPAQQRDGHVE